MAKMYKAKPETTYNAGEFTFNLKSVRPGLFQRAVQVEFPTPPTYEARTATGRIEKLPLDEASIQTKEDKERWERYTEQMQQMRIMQNEKMERVLFGLGVEQFTIPDEIMAEWELELQVLGIYMPENPVERRILFLSTWLSLEDKTNLIKAIMALSGVGEATIAEAEKTFRPELPE